MSNICTDARERLKELKLKKNNYNMCSSEYKVIDEEMSRLYRLIMNTESRPSKGVTTESVLD